MKSDDDMLGACDRCGTPIDVHLRGPVLDKMIGGSYLCPECLMDEPLKFVKCKGCRKRFGFTDLAESYGEWVGDPKTNSFVCRKCASGNTVAESSPRHSCSLCHQADGIIHVCASLQDDHFLDSGEHRWLCHSCWDRPEAAEYRQKLEIMRQRLRQEEISLFRKHFQVHLSERPVN